MTPAREIDASGWDRPLDVDWDWQINVLRRCIRDEAPSKGGALQQAFQHKRSVVINKKQTEITISVKPPDPAAPYAAAQNFGSGLYGPKAAKYRIPRIDNLTAKVLRFLGRGGKWVFRKFVMHPGVRGQHYVEKGIIKWWKKLTGGKYTVVKWREGKVGASFGETRGTLSA